MHLSNRAFLVRQNREEARRYQNIEAVVIMREIHYIVGFKPAVLQSAAEGSFLGADQLSRGTIDPPNGERRETGGQSTRVESGTASELYQAGPISGASLWP